jgi:hypothetical protein
MGECREVNPLLGNYNRYSGVSRLNTNVNKSAVLCLKTSLELKPVLNAKRDSPKKVNYEGIPTLSTALRSGPVMWPTEQIH